MGHPVSPRPNTTASPGKKHPPLASSEGEGRFLPRRHERMAIEPPPPTAPSAPQPAFLLPPGDGQRAARAQPERPQQARRGGCGGARMHQHRAALTATTRPRDRRQGSQLRAPPSQPHPIVPGGLAVAAEAPQAAATKPHGHVANGRHRRRRHAQQSTLHKLHGHQLLTDTLHSCCTAGRAEGWCRHLAASQESSPIGAARTPAPSKHRSCHRNGTARSTGLGCRRARRPELG